MSDAVWIGLCGRSGSGKGYVSAVFAEQGIPAIDTDAVYRKMTGPVDTLSDCMKELAAVFGEVVVNPDGSLNRRAMADLVFAENGAEARAKLNRITHAHIWQETCRIADSLHAQGSQHILIDAPLLFESWFDAHCRYTVCVTAPDAICVTRIMARDGISDSEARRRLASQISAEDLAKRCDYVIVNDGITPVRAQVEKILVSIQNNGGTE